MLLTLAIGATGCGPGQPAAPAAGAGRAGGPAVPVETLVLQATPVDDIGEFVGTLRSQRSTTIQPQAEGFVTRLFVKPGDRVARGAALFEIDATALRAALSSLESIRAGREADAELARQQADRARGLLAVGAASQQELDQAQARLKTAEAQLKATDEQIRQQQAELGYYRVTAPTAGVVSDIPVRLGDRVTRTTRLTTIEDNSGLELYVNVPVQQAANLKVGLPVRIVDEAGALLATERVSFVSPVVDDATQTVLVRTPVSAGAGTFRSDQFVRAHVVFQTQTGVAIPVVSALRINGQYFVFVVENGPSGPVARQRPVSVGRVIGNTYVVRSGVKAGDQIVTGGIQKLGEGAAVAPQGAAAPAGGR